MLARVAILRLEANGLKMLANLQLVSGSSYALVSRKFWIASVFFDAVKVENSVDACWLVLSWEILLLSGLKSEVFSFELFLLSVSLWPCGCLKPFVSAVFNMVSRDGHVFRLCRVPVVQIDLDKFFTLENYTAVKCSGLKVNYSYEFYKIRVKMLS